MGKFSDRLFWVYNIVIDLIGRQYGKLKVLKRVKNDKRGNSRWLCLCDCKNKSKIIVLGFNLKRNHTRSCGCLKKNNALKHGHKKNRKETGFYRSWKDMKNRCINPNNKNYHNYGGHGITICEEWSEFPNFLKDMPGWRPGLQIERINNNKGYCKENCEWATRKQQMRNRRDNRYETYKGKNRLLIELCEEHNIPYVIVYNRIYSCGWSTEEALTIPVGQRRKEFK